MASQSQDTGDNQGDEGARHVNLAVGEIDHANNAVHHRVANGDQGVDAAESQTVNDLLAEFEEGKTGHGGCVLGGNGERG